MDSTQKVMPLPELLGREGFEVREAKDRRAYVDFGKKQFVVPFDNDPHAGVIRAHENMHVQITPRKRVKVKVEGAENRTMQAIEDCRVNAALRAVGIDTTPAPPAGIDETSIRNLPNQSPLEQARALIAYHGRAEESLTRSVVTEPWIVEAADEIIERFDRYEKNGKTAPWSVTIKAIEDLTRKMNKPPEPEEDEDNSEESEDESGEEESEDEGSGGMSEDDSEDESEEDESDESEDEGNSESGDSEDEDSDDESDEDSEDDGSGAEDASDESEDEDEGNSSSEGSEDSEDDSEDDGETDLNAEDAFDPIEGEPAPLPEMTDEEMEDARKAGLPSGCAPSGYRDGSFQRMEICHPPLTLPLPRPRSLSKRASDVGSIPTQIHRLTSDGRIFRERGMGREGIAILFDVSGSMDITPEEVDAILTLSPASVIATYTGLSRSPNNYGWLSVIAENKRRVSNEVISNFRFHPETGAWGGENLVDLPAIEWLAKRKERRKIWISDAKVTGQDVRGAITTRIVGHEFRKLAKVILEHKIERIDSVQDAIESMKTRRF